MAITVTRTAYGKPTLSLSLVAGGSLPVGVTLYYRVATASYFYPWYSGDHYQSPVSDVQSITTDAVNRSVQLTVTHSTGAAEYTMIWCSQGVDPGAGNWTDRGNYPDIRYIGAGSLYLTTITGAKLTTVTDDGTLQGWTSDRYRLGDGANYAYCPLYDDGRDLLKVSGGSSADPATFEDIYQYVVAQGWPTASTISRPAEHVYQIRAQNLQIADTLTDGGCSVILDGCFLLASGDCILGTLNAAGETYDGVNITLAGHGEMSGSVQASGDFRLYSSVVEIRKPSYSYTTPYRSALWLAGTHFDIVDCDVLGGINDGLKISSNDSSSRLLRVRAMQNRYSLYLTTATAFSAEDLQIDTNIRAQHTDDVARSLSGLTAFGTAGAGAWAWLYIAKPGGYRSMLNLIDATIYDWSRIYWYWQSPAEDVSLVLRQYSVNLLVKDASGPISGATITVEDSAGGTVATATTAADGTITEQIVTTKMYKPNISLGASHYQDPDYVTDYGPHTITISADGYQTYTWSGEITEAIDWEVSMLADVAVVTSQGVTARLSPGLRATLSGPIVARLKE